MRKLYETLKLQPQLQSLLKPKLKVNKETIPDGLLKFIKRIHAEIEEVCDEKVYMAMRWRMSEKDAVKKKQKKVYERCKEKTEPLPKVKAFDVKYWKCFKICIEGCLLICGRSCSTDEAVDFNPI